MTYNIIILFVFLDNAQDAPGQKILFPLH